MRPYSAFSSLLISAFFSLAPVSPLKAQDARALLLKVGQAYQSLTSLESTAAVVSRVTKERATLQEAGMTVKMRFAKPNKFFLDIGRREGSVRAYCDGTTLYAYDVAHNLYIKDPAPKTLLGVMQKLYVRMGVIANLDPLYFLVYSVLPPELGDLKFGGYQMLEGVRCAVVTGVTRRKEMTLKTSTGKAVKLPAVTQSWTWWIDGSTFLLKKVESRNTSLPVMVPVRQGKTVKQVSILATQFSRHFVSAAAPNVRLSPDTFQFIPPPGAVEKVNLSGKKP